MFKNTYLDPIYFQYTLFSRSFFSQSYKFSLIQFLFNTTLQSDPDLHSAHVTSDVIYPNMR